MKPISSVRLRLNRKQKPDGMSQGEWNQEITDQIGGGPNGRTRAEVAQDLRDWFVTFTPAA